MIPILDAILFMYGECIVDLKVGHSYKIGKDPSIIEIDLVRDGEREYLRLACSINIFTSVKITK